MYRIRSPRRLAAPFAAALLMLTIAAAPADAGVVARSGSTLQFTSGFGQTENLQVRQNSATSITFDDISLPITTTAAPNCFLTIGQNITCTGVAWTKVTVDLRDGNDFVNGQTVNAILQVPLEADGGPGSDRIEGGNVDDVLDVGADGGSAVGRLGNDILRSGANGNTDLFGLEGDDTIDARTLGSTDSAFLSGGPGTDTLRGGASSSTLDGGDGVDLIVGGAGNERINAGSGTDTASGGDGDDTIHGGFVVVGATIASDGADTLSGGPGSDSLDYRERTVAVVVDLASTTNGELGENDATALDFEGVLGGRGADTLTGNGTQNLLRGNDGDDTLEGRGATDQLYSGDGNDTINAAGDLVADVIHCGSTPAGDADTANLDHLDILELFADCETVDRAAPPAPETPPQVGNVRPNSLTGTRRADLIFGAAGNDTLRGLGGNDLLRGGIGNDRLFGGFGNDDLDGDAGNDTLFGEFGTDTLDGGTGRDLLRGGPGIDTLVGGRGVDNLDGGPGKDYLYSNDRARFDVVTCTRVNLANRLQRRQRDVVVASRGDVIVNRAWCASVTFA